MVNNFTLSAVGDKLQLGKQGGKIVLENGKIVFKNNQETQLINIQAASPTNNNDVATKQYVDGLTFNLASAVLQNPDANAQILYTNSLNELYKTSINKSLYYPAVAGEIGILNYEYVPGDCRRYGIFPDGITNWEGSNLSGRVINFMTNCALPNIIGYMPPGIYNTSMNWSNTAYSGAKVIMDGVQLNGIFHVQSSAEPAINDPKLTNLRFYGNITILDRLGLNNIQDVIFDNVRMKSDAANNLATPGSKGRGIHIYFGCDDVRINSLIVDDCENGNNTDAALAIDGNGANPTNIRINRVWIKKSDCHGAYITGFNHFIDELRIDEYAKLQPTRGIQDSDGLAQSQQGCGVWLNRVTGTINKIITNQANETRVHAIYDVRIDETGLNNSNELTIGSITMLNVGVGGSGRGMCIGDREYATGSGQVNVNINDITAYVATNAVLTSGFEIVQINQRTSNTRANIKNNINLYNPNTNTGLKVEVGARFLLNGILRYTNLGSGISRGTALNVLGYAKIIGGVDYFHNGSSLDVPAVNWAATNGSFCGPIFCDASLVNNKKALAITGSGTEIGPLTSNNLRSAAGTIAINILSNTIIKLGNISSGSTILAGTLGIRLTGTISDVSLIGGRITGFDTGITKGTATLTRLSALNTVSTGNTTNTTLTVSDGTNIGTATNIFA
jgi:hypothetical protein